jgi:hypothetical protein
MRPLALLSPGVQSRQRGVRSHLVNEEQSLGLHLLGEHNTFQAALKNASRSSAPTVRFFGEAQPLHQPPYGGVAKGRGGYVLQEVTSLADGGAWTLLYVLFEKDSGFLVGLAGPSRALSGLKGTSFSGGSGVALDRGERFTSNKRAA